MASDMDEIQLFVKPMAGSSLSINISPSATLSDLYVEIERRTRVPRRSFTAVLGSRLLPSDNSLSIAGCPDGAASSLLDFGLSSGATVAITCGLRGGTNAPSKAKMDFNQKPPPGYVAGLGRGATGFTTRSDIGPARAAPDMEKGSVGRGRGAGGPPGAPGGGRDDEGDDEGGKEAKYDENQKFDEFEGNDVGLFATGEYDEDDKEADEVWDEVDRRMDDRRRDRREARLKQEIEKFRENNPKITEQFADLKRGLGQMSAADWDTIPEIGDYSLKNKKKRFESFVPVPDTLLEKARQEQEHGSSLDPRGKGSTLGGIDTPFGQTPVTDLTAVGEGRGTVLSLKLDRLSDSVTGQTVVDPKGYLTDLKSMRITSDAEISDIKKARLLLKSVIQTNPKHAPGWIAAARLEEVAGKLQAARAFISKGCDECPKNEDVWLEACRLAPPDAARAVIARGVKELPQSVKLWMHAARLEKDDAGRSKVLRRALEQIPDSVRLWKAVVELANEDDARILLARAVECCPLHVELWLALARLESYENAKRVLNRAREVLPTEPAVWITAAKLEEANGNAAMVGKIVDRAIRSLQREGVAINREAWMKEAEAAEKGGSAETCRAIIRATVGTGVEEEDRKRTWVADAEESVKRGAVETARAILAHALSVFPGKKSVWRRAAELEKAHGTRESLDALLRRAVTYCPQAQVLWLMGAKEKWLAGDVPAARAILEEAYAAIPDSEEIWLAAFKLEFENREHQRARKLLQKARERGGRERVWMKSAILEREAGDVGEERKLLEGGLQQFPAFPKLWLMLGQLEERLGRLPAAKEAYARGLRHCPHSVPLWLSAAALEEQVGGASKARAVLDQARLKNPKCPELWLAAVRTEARTGSRKMADAVLARALQECPVSGVLWAEAIEAAPRPAKKARSVDALKKCDHDAHVIAAVARLFAADRKVDKARSWFERAVTLAPGIGDLWAHYARFERAHGDDEKRASVAQRCAAAEPRHGELWTRVSKAVENSHLTTDAILKKVVLLIEKEAAKAEGNDAKSLKPAGALALPKAEQGTTSVVKKEEM